MRPWPVIQTWAARNQLSRTDLPLTLAELERHLDDVAGDELHLGRYRVVDSRPCPCGRAGRRVVSIRGRNDDILRLPARTGGDVAVHPLTLRSPFARLPQVRQYKVVLEGSGLRVLVVPGDGAKADVVTPDVYDALGVALADAGALPSAIRVEVVARIPREPGHGSKFKIIENRAGAPSAVRDGGRRT